MKVELSPTHIPGTGVLAQVPLRRMSVPVSTEGDSRVAVSFPGVELHATSSNYHRALAAIERLPRGIKVSVELFKAALVNGSSDWTVTGESLLGASALAELFVQRRGRADALGVATPLPQPP